MLPLVDSLSLRPDFRAILQNSFNYMIFVLIFLVLLSKEEKNRFPCSQLLFNFLFFIFSMTFSCPGPTSLPAGGGDAPFCLPTAKTHIKK